MNLAKLCLVEVQNANTSKVRHVAKEIIVRKIN